MCVCVEETLRSLLSQGDRRIDTVISKAAPKVTDETLLKPNETM